MTQLSTERFSNWRLPESGRWGVIELLQKEQMMHSMLLNGRKEKFTIQSITESHQI